MTDPSAQIRTSVEAIRRIAARKSTSSLAGWCLADSMRRANDLDYRGGLTSPARQMAFLLGVMLGTRAPVVAEQVHEEEWAQLCEILDAAFSAYQELFWPETVSPDPGDAWWHVREVAMPTFMHYFNTGLLASVPQIVNRVRRYLAPFDTELEDLTGVSATDAIEIAAWLAGEFENSIERVLEFQSELQTAHHSMQGLPSHLVAKRAEAEGDLERAAGLRTALEEMGFVDRQRLVARFSAFGATYWECYSVARGTGPRLVYPTEPSIVETKPLIRVGVDRAFCTSANNLFLGVLNTCEAALTASEHRARYFAHRDRVLEDEVAEYLPKLLDPGAILYRTLFETPTAHGEHDLIAISGDLLLVVEAKASPPKEPLRDPDRAFMRIKHAFQSDTGIQKAFDQGASVCRRLEAGSRVPLYDRMGTLVVELDPTVLVNRHTLCVTRDNFGPLATDLSLLLEKDATEPYPWAVNILDLDAIGDAWQFLRWGTDRLRGYLDERVRVHGSIFGTDELEYVGYFIRHRTLKSPLRGDRVRLVLNPSYSNFFDELHYHLEHGLPAPEVKVTEPHVMDLRQSLKEGTVVSLDDLASRAIGIGRNDPCPCGSGRKYKKCHG